MTVQANAGIAKIEVGGRTYPVVSERRCRVCCSGLLRTAIEEQTVSGKSWAVIAAELPPERGLTARNVKDHFVNGHFPLEEPTVQALVDRQAQQRGEVVEQAVAVVVDHLGFLGAVVGTVNKQVITGEAQPTVRDAIAAAALLARYDPGPQMSHEYYERLFSSYHQVVADVLSIDQFSVLSQRSPTTPDSNSYRRSGKPCTRKIPCRCPAHSGLHGHQSLGESVPG